jgi:hypothetical protein
MYNLSPKAMHFNVISEAFLDAVDVMPVPLSLGDGRFKLPCLIRKNVTTFIVLGCQTFMSDDVK